MTNPIVADTDDWATMRDQMLREARVRGGMEDCNNEARTTLALTVLRGAAGMSRADVAAWLANYTGMKVSRARRLVDQFEDGELGSGTPIWLLHAYARAVGAKVTLVVGAGGDSSDRPAETPGVAR